MNQQELNNLIDYIEELRRRTDVGYLEAEEETIEAYHLGYKTACEVILDKIERLEETKC